MSSLDKAMKEIEEAQIRLTAIRETTAPNLRSQGIHHCCDLDELNNKKEKEGYCPYFLVKRMDDWSVIEGNGEKGGEIIEQRLGRDVLNCIYFCPYCGEELDY